jgi:sRNA-binding carbon storage regulator CsrA
MALFVDIGANDTLTVGETTVKLQYKKGSKVRLKIDAPKDIAVKLHKDTAETKS